MAKIEDAKAAVQESAEQEGSQPITAALGSAAKFLQAFGALVPILTSAFLALQNYRLLLLITVVLYGLVLAFYAAFHAKNDIPERRRLARLKAGGWMIGIAFASLAALFLYSYAPRTREPGSTIAISKFTGPELPSPYDKCRPSAEVVHALSDVADRYGWLHVYEVPWSVDPNERLAAIWAKGHGGFEAADVIVYGDYGLATSVANGKASGKANGKADEKADEKADAIIINPRADAVPRLPIADNVPPLYSWEFKRSKVSIARLCGGSVFENAKSPARNVDNTKLDGGRTSIGLIGEDENFIDDIRRLALSIVGARLFATQDYLGAQDALSEAKAGLPQVACQRGSLTNPCRGGVLYYYLANLDVRFGNFSDAKVEYENALAELESSTPHLSLAELDFRLGDRKQGFNELARAVWADPTSVAARATKSLYERQYFLPRKAAIDLDRALNMRATHFYDLSALSRALYDRGSGQTEGGLPTDAGKRCGIKTLLAALRNAEFDKRTMLETYVRYGIWLWNIGDPGATETFVSALEISPDNIKANYWMGRDMNKRGRGPEAEAFFHRAVYARGFDDEDFLTQGDAANELRKFAKTRRQVAASLRPRDDARVIDAQQDEGAMGQVAFTKYKLSIGVNRNASNAYNNLAILETDLGDKQLARYYHDEAIKRSALSVSTTGTRKPLRIAPEEQLLWSNQNCRYTHMKWSSCPWPWCLGR